MKKLTPDKASLKLDKELDELSPQSGGDTIPAAQPLHGAHQQQILSEDADRLQHAQEIVRELYVRYEKQVQRWIDYRNLFVFLGFVTLFLATLYLQRNAHVAYKVHSTIESVVLPDTDTMQDTDSVYNWLQQLLQTVWQDPICGDGLCESPFEFASYGRFGCRADCGKLSEVQNLTTVQVDIYYDFTHPTGSIPASDLMSQASWNLCPINGTPASDCYYEQDATFSQLSGEQHVSIDDVPDGSWTLRVKQDIFNKIAGSVRDTNALQVSSYYDKVYIALVSARAEQAYEIGLLQKAVSISNNSLLEYMWAAGQATTPAMTTDDLQILINASCYCTNGTEPLRNTTWRTADGQPGVLDLNWYLNGATTLALKVNGSVTTLKGCAAAASLGQPLVPMEKNNGTLVAVTNDTAWCATNMNSWQGYSGKYWDTMKQLLVDTRLGDDGRTSGKKFIRFKTRNDLRGYVQNYFPERIAWTFTQPTGTDAVANPAACRLDELTRVYVESPTYALDPPPAYSNLTRTKVYKDTTITAPILGLRAAARIAEIYNQQNEVLMLQIPVANLSSFTVGRLYAAYQQAGANISTVPVSSNLGAPLTLDYNYISWDGNTTSYIMCSLHDRAPTYTGVCQASATSCQKTNNENHPWNCTVLSTGATIDGFINETNYRQNCETICEHNLDCNTICECYGACGANQVCMCEACTTMASDATSDSEFQSIESAAVTGGSSAQAVADIGISGRKRSLLQSNSTVLTDSLSQVLTKVDQLRVQQTTITTQMASLQTQVQQANQLAEQRAQDKTLEQLIQAGRADIQAGQKRVEAKLDEILGKQNQMQAVADQAAKVLQSISDLSQRQLEAQQALEKAVQSQLYAIKVAAQQNIISLAQALELWKRARRDRATATKAAKLANIPCSSQPTQNNQFTIDRHLQDSDGDQHRERNIGLTNRVIAGMLVHTWRTKQVKCAKSRFDQIQSQCTGGEDLRPYGVDPVFKRGTDLYNPDLDDIEHAIVLGYYNCSQFNGKPTYNVSDQTTGQVTNGYPYCAELYNPRTLPWGFHFFQLDGLPNGFPVWFDIDLSADDAQTWFTYLQDGLYLDSHTRGLIAHMVTYNAELRIFGAYRVKFFFSDGGSIQITHRLHTLRVELYHTPADQLRMALEVILSMCVFIQLVVELWRVFGHWKAAKSVWAYFKSGWNWVHLISNILLTCCIIIWWSFATQHAKHFRINMSYKVYEDLEPTANFLQLHNDGQGLNNGWHDFRALDDLINMLNWYYALNGINILLLIARVLKLMDFQPRLGVVTRSLALAGPDLIHFSLVAGMVFVGYAMMAHLIFGNAIDEFASFSRSINTCFEILLGNIDVNDQLRALPGLQNLAGTLFFWSYELLVFMVLLNFLLAIIVDAFSEVKENTQETTGLHTELGQIFRDKWRSLVGACTGNYISDQKLGLLLKQWAGQVETAEEETLVEEVTEKKLQVLGEELDEDTLREILEACLLDSAPVDEDEKKGIRAFFASGRSSQASKEELELAAKYVIDRFGAQSSEAHEDAGEMGQDEGVPEGHQAKDMAAEKERDQLAHALERLADVQRELAEGQRSLMSGQKQLAEQQARLVALMRQEVAPKPQ